MFSTIFNEISERYKKSFEARNATWIIVGKIIQMILSFYVGVLVARYLGPKQYGIINYVAAYTLFFASFCTLGINSIIVKEFVDYPQEQGVIIGTTIVLRLISSLLSYIIIVLIVFILDHDNPTILLIALLYSLSLFFEVSNTFNYWFLSKYLSKICTLGTLYAYALTSLYKIYLVKTEKPLAWFAFSITLDYICISVFLVYAYLKNKGQPLKVSWKKGRDLLALSTPYILSGMMVAIYAQTDKLMLKQLMNETEVGYYSLAITINNMWVFVLSAIISSLTPTICHLFNVDRELFNQKNRQLYTIVIYMSSFVAICFTIFGKKFIQVVYGIEYINTANSLYIICWYTAFSYLGVARNSWIVCNRLQKYLIFLTGMAAGANVILNLILIPIWGAPGAAAASLITQVSTIVIPLFIKELRPNLLLMIDALFLRGLTRSNNSL